MFSIPGKFVSRQFSPRKLSWPQHLNDKIRSFMQNVIMLNVMALPGRCQFHQYFMSSVFCTKAFCAAFLCLQFGFVIFWRKDFGTKAAHKMLVKLTPVACIIIQANVITIVKSTIVNVYSTGHRLHYPSKKVYYSECRSRHWR